MKMMKMKMKMMKIKVKMSMMMMKKVSHDDGYFVMKVILWWNLSRDESNLVMKVMIVKELMTGDVSPVAMFWEKMLSHGQTVHFRPHRKAKHLRIPKFRLKVNFRHPMKRQIFGDTSGQDPNFHLALCQKLIKVPTQLGKADPRASIGDWFPF